MKRFLVIGLGEFGREVARTLTSEGAEVIGVDSHAGVVEDIKDEIDQVVCFDATDEEALKSLGLEGIEVAVVAMAENREASILITAILRELGVGRIVARALDPLHGRILERVGAERVIYPEMQMARQVAKSLIAPSVLERVILAENHSLVEIASDPSFWKQSVLQTGIRGQYNLLVVGIFRDVPEVKDSGEVFERTKFISMPGPSTRIQEGDRLLVIGHDDNIERLLKLSRRTALKD
ncbi:MAG: TrkA family potassium uptake protein [Candidatus Latescibacterota bacterium]